ncbi:MAG: hypothetical protein ACHQX1_00140 [Candidatus Micrarchaeales archaeon]
MIGVALARPAPDPESKARLEAKVIAGEGLRLVGRGIILSNEAQVLGKLAELLGKDEGALTLPDLVNAINANGSYADLVRLEGRISNEMEANEVTITLLRAAEDMATAPEERQPLNRQRIGHWFRQLDLREGRQTEIHSMLHHTT